MKTTKKTKKTKPLFVVYLSKATNSAEAMLAFADARFEAGLPLKERDYDIIVLETMRWTLDTVTEMANDILTMMEIAYTVNEHVKKSRLPWYKRLWNWITRKK